MKEQAKNIIHGIAGGLFWSWNIIFLAFMFLGFAPTVLPKTITAVRTNAIPASTTGTRGRTTTRGHVPATSKLAIRVR